MAIVILSLKLYISNKRAKSKVGRMISTIDNNLLVQYRQGNNKIEDPIKTNNMLLWNQIIYKIIQERDLKIKHKEYQII